MTALITKTYPMLEAAEYQGVVGVSTRQVPFVFREDGWFNMTKAAKAFGKQLPNFWRSPETHEYCEAVRKAFNLKPLSEATLGRYGATWAHPKLAVFFARWLDVRFAVWCDAVIDDILKGKAIARPGGLHEVVITKPAESSVPKPTQEPPQQRH